MLSDLAVTAMLGAAILLVIAVVVGWLARTILGGGLPFGGRLALRPSAARRSPGALLVANQAAAPFMHRYAVMVGALALLTVLLAFVSDVAAVVVHLLAVLMLALGVVVCVKKAGGARDVAADGASGGARTASGD